MRASAPQRYSTRCEVRASATRSAPAYSVCSASILRPNLKFRNYEASERLRCGNHRGRARRKLRGSLCAPAEPADAPRGKMRVSAFSNRRIDVAHEQRDPPRNRRLAEDRSGRVFSEVWRALSLIEWHPEERTGFSRESRARFG